MIDIARRRVPEAELRNASLFEADIPPCDAVTSLSEVFNYLFDPDNDRQTLVRLFRRVHDALTPGVSSSSTSRSRDRSHKKPGQRVLGGRGLGGTGRKKEDRAWGTLTRRITSFRKVGEHYRRAFEVHHQRLYKATDVAEELRRVGFGVQMRRSYGRCRLPRAHAAFVARKSGTRQR